MEGRATVVRYVLTMVVVVLAVDVLFFRNHFWLRLMANIGIVLVLRRVLFQVPENRFGAPPRPRTYPSRGWKHPAHIARGCFRSVRELARHR